MKIKFLIVGFMSVLMIWLFASFAREVPMASYKQPHSSDMAAQ